MNTTELRERIVEVLSEVYMPEGVAIWLSATHKSGPLMGRSPNSMIDAGEGMAVLAAAENLTGQIAT